MRRRAVARAAVIGGAAHHAGRRGERAAQREAEQDARIADLQAQVAQPQAPGPVAPTTSAVPTMEEKIEQIRQLAKLRDDGILTDEEFAGQKQAILGS
jgi:hypothetical protein